MDRLDPTLDVVFKRLMLEDETLLYDMLQGVLGRPIQSFTVKNPHIPGDLASDKEIILDIQVVLHDGTQVDVDHNGLLRGLSTLLRPSPSGTASS